MLLRALTESAPEDIRMQGQSQPAAGPRNSCNFDACAGRRDGGPRASNACAAPVDPQDRPGATVYAVAVLSGDCRAAQLVAAAGACRARSAAQHSRLQALPGVRGGWHAAGRLEGVSLACVKEALPRSPALCEGMPPTATARLEAGAPAGAPPRTSGRGRLRSRRGSSPRGSR